MSKIRIGIVGYGNIGRGVEQAIKRNEDMELAAVFTRRDPASVKVATEGAKVMHMDDMLSMKGDVDVMVLCGGSATDLPVMGPEIAANFNTIDSFDTHAKIPEYFANVDKAAKEGNNIGIISVGWDPGMFSLNRLYAESILVQGSTYTFWGKGVSQGKCQLAVHPKAKAKMKAKLKELTSRPTKFIRKFCIWKQSLFVNNFQSSHETLP